MSHESRKIWKAFSLSYVILVFFLYLISYAPYDIGVFVKRVDFLDTFAYFFFPYLLPFAMVLCYDNIAKIFKAPRTHFLPLALFSFFTYLISIIALAQVFMRIFSWEVWEINTFKGALYLALLYVVYGAFFQLYFGYFHRKVKKK